MAKIRHILQYKYDPKIRVELKEGENTIGRYRNNSIRLDDPLISRHHAKITVNNGMCEINDLGSSNGTYVGKTRLDGSQLTILINGMDVTFAGPSTLVEDKYQQAFSYTYRKEVESPKAEKKSLLSRMLS